MTVGHARCAAAEAGHAWRRNVCRRPLRSLTTRLRFHVQFIARSALQFLCNNCRLSKVMESLQLVHKICTWSHALQLVHAIFSARRSTGNKKMHVINCTSRLYRDNSAIERLHCADKLAIISANICLYLAILVRFILFFSSRFMCVTVYDSAVGLPNTSEWCI